MKRELEIKPTPLEMARDWWEMDSINQAQFFIELARLRESEGEFKFDTQMLYVRESLDAAGLAVPFQIMLPEMER